MTSKTPFSTRIVLTSTETRRRLSELAEAAGQDAYANAVQKTDDGSAFLISFYSFDALDANEMRGRLILLSEMMEIEITDILSAETTPVEDKNWLEEVHQAFPPRAIGRFYVYGSHVTPDQIPDGLIALKIDAWIFTPQISWIWVADREFWPLVRPNAGRMRKFWERISTQNPCVWLTAMLK